MISYISIHLIKGVFQIGQIVDIALNWGGNSEKGIVIWNIR
jgi:hypothetical protein